jgi:hypothetical protein
VEQLLTGERETPTSGCFSEKSANFFCILSYSSRRAAAVTR